MYHNEIPESKRGEYVQLLTQAEQMFQDVGSSREVFTLVCKACSAVRGSEEVLQRMQYPLNARQVVQLAELLMQSRRYVKNFWGNVASSPSPKTDKEAKSPTPAQPKIKPTEIGEVKESKTVRPATVQPTPSPDIRQHLDQYVHTLSPKLQGQAQMLHQKYAALNDAHETLDRLVRDNLDKPKTDNLSKQIAFYAKKVDQSVRAIDAFWRRVQAERDALAGKEVTEEYRQYLKDEEAKYPIEEPLRSWGEYTKAEIDEMADDDSLSEEGNPTLRALGCTADDLVKARQHRNKALLRRKAQLPLSDEARNIRIEAMEELHEWGEPIHRKQKEMLESLGIEVPEEYLNPFINMTDEERLERKRENERRNSSKYYERHKPLATKMGIARQMKKDKKDDDPYKQSDLQFED